MPSIPDLPPQVYYLMPSVIVILALVYWRRKTIAKELQRWRLSELLVGPLKLARKSRSETLAGEKNAPGVEIGTDAEFEGVTIKNVEGRDRISGPSEPSKKDTPSGVRIGVGGKFKNSNIENVTGRDRRQEHK